VKIKLIAALAATILSASAYAQSGGYFHNPAIKDPHARTTTVAARGRNSFTESQARGRIMKAGYSRVSGLAKNRNGVWQGKAMRGKRMVRVALDYKGNVTVH